MRYVYLAGPITGVRAAEAQDWRNDPLFRRELQLAGWEPLSPFDGIKGYAEQTVEGDGPIPGWFEDKVDGKGAAMKAFTKDVTYIQEAAAVLANFNGARHASVGTMCELGYAYGLKKPIVVVMDRSHPNVHDHPFVIGPSDFVVPTLADAIGELKYLGQLMQEPQYA